jgi:hypothetical protein
MPSAKQPTCAQSSRPRGGPLSISRELAEHARRIAGIDEHGRDHHGPAARRGDRLQPRDRGRHALGEHEDAAAGLAERAREREQLALVGEARRHRNPVLAVVLLERGRREADRAGAHGLEHERRISAISASVAATLGGVGAEHPRADRRVADEGATLGTTPAAPSRRGTGDTSRSPSRRPPRSASSDIPSTCVSARSVRSRSAGRHGAIVKPQLPMTTVVTPSAVDGVANGSHVSWAS